MDFLCKIKKYIQSKYFTKHYFSKIRSAVFSPTIEPIDIPIPPSRTPKDIFSDNFLIKGSLFFAKTYIFQNLYNIKNRYIFKLKIFL